MLYAHLADAAGITALALNVSALLSRWAQAAQRAEALGRRDKDQVGSLSAASRLPRWGALAAQTYIASLPVRSTG